MNKSNASLAIPRWCALLWAVVAALCLTASPARAGGWEIEGYYWSGSAKSSHLTWYYSSYEKKYFTAHDKWSLVARDQRHVNTDTGAPHSIDLSTSPMRGSNYGGAPFLPGIRPGASILGASVYARLVWKRNPSYYEKGSGQYIASPDPYDNPPPYIYVRESGSLFASQGLVNGNRSILNAWQGDYYDIKASNSMGLQLTTPYRLDNNYSWWVLGRDSKQLIKKIPVSNDSVVVPSQTFGGSINVSPGYEQEGADQDTTASLGYGYNVDPINFGLNANVNTTASSKQTVNAEEIEALVGLHWLYPEDAVIAVDGNYHAKPDRNLLQNQWDGFWAKRNIEGGGLLDERAPLPYFEGSADFSAYATGSDGQTPIFKEPVYKWAPEGTSEAFDVPGAAPHVKVTSDSQRSYAWNFGTLTDDSVSLPKTTSVSVTMTGTAPDDPSGSLSRTVNIHWYTVWTPTQTGLEKNVVTPSGTLLTTPDGQPVPMADIHEGDTVLCIVSGDPGFSTDGGRTEKIRPLKWDDAGPGPGERIEPRRVRRIVSTEDGARIITFESKPQVNPDDDPDAPGFDEIQQTRAIKAAYIETKETGRVLVTTALNAYVEAAKFVSTGRLQGWGIEGAIKGVVALGKLATATREAKAGIALLEGEMFQINSQLTTLRRLQQEGRLSISQRAKLAEDIYTLENALKNEGQLAADARGTVAAAENYLAKAGTEARQGGCFVAGTLVWMADGATKPIEQVKVGESVLSKNEKTGEVAAKKVINTSVRPDIWTRKLTFEGGAVLETTDEHPLYVEGSGFAKAKEVGIGSSIVTRAGPGAKVVGVQADVRQTTVYNFTVDEFHSYFVGDAALWVHNVDCNVWDNINPTQEVYPNTVIPKSFELTTEQGRVWVHPNASEHAVEMLVDLQRNRGIDPLSETGKFAQQVYLANMRDAVSKALAQNNLVGITERVTFNIDNWELTFAPPTAPGQLPALIHALPKGVVL